MYTYDEVFQATLEYFNGDELATNVFFKYALKDKNGNYYEKTPDDMHKRLAKEFARIEKKFGGKNQLGEQKIYEHFKDFKYIVPQGSPMYGVGNNFQNVSLSNCFVIDSPSDNMSGIVNSGRDLANISKRRGGVGIDISTLRPDGAHVSNSAGTSSGAWSFGDFYSNIARMVGQSGRRAALILTLDVKHPDVEKFITMKKDLTKVTGANISIKISDEFMNAVKDDQDFTLQFPVDSENPIFTRIVKAKELWNLIVETATETAEPGILMWDNILKMLPAECYKDLGYKTVCTNPCSELPLNGGGGSCILISNNLKYFVDNPFTDSASFNFKQFAKTVKVAQRLCDDLVELELEKIQNIINIADTKDEKELFKKIYNTLINGRRTGIGTHGLADALARLQITYASEESMKIVDKIYEILKTNSYQTSVDLAKERGAFPVWNWDLEKDNLFIKSLPQDLQQSIKTHGRRNISNLTLAPTGSVSILSKTSSGMEPVFKNVYMRRRKRNHNEEKKETDFVDKLGDHWEEFEVYHHNVKEWINSNPNKELPNYFIEADKIDWCNKIKMQSFMQRHIDHSISNTINLPKGTSPKLVSRIYMLGWESGLKGVTVYVDGSRDGVLIKKEEKQKEFHYVDAPSRDDELECDIHNVSIKGEKWVILVGLMNNKPYEVFGGLSENIEIPSRYKKGLIIKVTEKKTKPNRYDLKLNGVKVKDIIKIFNNPNYQVHTRMVSLALRHGTKPSFLVEQLLKDPDSDLTSFSKVLARVLKKYIEDGTSVRSGERYCQNCESELIYKEGCVSCMNCGWNRCS
jgi:ribonucleoside-diphosphate reductase alpha chain